MSIYFTRQLSLCLAVIPRCPHCPPHTQTHTHAHTHTVYLYPSVPPLSSFRQALLPLSSHSHSGGIHSTVWHQALLGWGDAMGGGVEGSCDQVGPFVCTAPLSFPALCAPGWGKKKERQKDVDDFQDTWGLDKPEPGTPTGDSIRLSQSTAFCFCYWLFFIVFLTNSVNHQFTRVHCSHGALICEPCFQPLYCFIAIICLSVLNMMRKMPSEFQL